jgi:hypothetical protein
MDLWPERFERSFAEAGYDTQRHWALYVPDIGIFFSILSVIPFWAIWLILVDRRLCQLGSSG